MEARRAFVGQDWEGSRATRRAALADVGEGAWPLAGSRRWGSREAVFAAAPAAGSFGRGAL